MADKSALLLGAGSLVAIYLLPRLVAAGYRVHTVGRGASSFSDERITHHTLDISDEEAASALPACPLVISLLPIPLLTQTALQTLLQRPETKRVIAFSSTSVLTKENSADSEEQKLVAGLKAGEDVLRCLTSSEITLFRPTLVYDDINDNNVTRIAALIRRFRFFPLIGRGKGLRQPVYAEDLAQAVLNVIENETSFSKCYELSGGEILSYRTMVAKIAEAHQMPVHFIPLPLWFARMLLAITKCLFGKRFSGVSAEALRRMGQDMIFDHGAAQNDFGFAPRRFLEAKSLRQD